VLPSQWREVGERRLVDRFALGAQVRHRALEVDGAPQHDRGGDEVQPARAVALLLETPIAILAEAVECAAG